jgi:hypothetical protein
MIVSVEQLFRDDLIQLNSGSRSIQPEHDDFYMVDMVQDFDFNHVAVWLVQIWDDMPFSVLVPRSELVEVLRVQP